jgi:hypothetical protein
MFEVFIKYLYRIKKIFMKKIILLLLLLSPTFSFSQKIILSGKSSTNSEPLPFVNIILKKTDNIYTSLSDIDGNYKIELDSGIYTIEASYLGYNKITISDFNLNSTNSVLNFEFVESETTLNEVTVVGVANNDNDISIIRNIRKLSNISDGISNQYIKKTPDRNVGDALKRISGVTIQNDKFVLVRGLSDRYNLAFLNRLPIPSTEPDRRSFSFDMIPTSLVDNIMVFKTSTANLPSDFAGGIVQVNTKEVSDNFTNVSFGIGGGTLTTFNNFIKSTKIPFPKTFPSTYTYRISSNGDKRLFTNQIETNQPYTSTALPNINGSITVGRLKNKFSTLLSSTIRNSNTINYIERQDYQSPSELAFKYDEVMYTNTFSVNGLSNITYLGKNKYSWKTLVNYQSQNSFINRIGENYDNLQSVDVNSTNNLNTIAVNSQLNATIDMWDVLVGYNYVFKSQPDYRILPLGKSLDGNDKYSTLWRDTYRFWSNMIDNDINTSVNRTINNLKIGGGYQKRFRDFNARIFRYNSIDILDEITNNTDRYNSTFDLANLYLMYDKQFGDYKLNIGFRNEYNTFKVNTADFSGKSITVDREYFDILPSLNFSNNRQFSNIRFSVSKTLSRPEFREVSNFSYYDFVRNSQLIGNPNLKKGEIYNFDFKYEYYPSSTESVFISTFAKQFNNPIEQVVLEGSVPSNLILSYSNPNSAILYGLEVEIKKSLSNLISIYSNTSIMNSNVKTVYGNRRLQGQSNYIINGGLNFTKDLNIITLSYNRIGDRISAIGFQGYTDIIEKSRNVMDITYLREIKNGEIKISVSDLFREPSVFYQQNDRNLIKTINETLVSLTLNLKI